MERSQKKAYEESFPCQFLFRDQFLSKGHGNGTVTEKTFKESFPCQFHFRDQFLSKGHGNGTVTEKHF